MAINKKLIKFATQARFDIFLANGDIDKSSVVFIEDTGRMWTQGRYYDPSWGNILNKPTKLSDFTDNLGIGTHIADNVKHITAAERTKWNASYGWGDFRDYGLGVAAITTTNADILRTSGFYNMTNSTVGNPSSYDSVALLNLAISANNVFQIAARTGDSTDMWFRTIGSNDPKTWRKVWHSGNLANGKTSQYIRGDGSLATYANTTYTTGTLVQLNAGSDTTGRLQTAKILNDWLNPKLNSKFDKTGGRLTTGTGDVNIELWRGTNASWNILNSGGYLRFQSNYTTVAGAYFDTLKLDYNTGNALFKGTVTAPRFNSGGKTSQYVRGDGTLATYANTTYTTGTLAQLNAGTDTTGRLHTAKLLNDWINAKKIDADTVDGFHASELANTYNYNTVATGSGYYKIKINSTSNWMLAFTIRIYQNYLYKDIVVTGYNYQNNNWHAPTALVYGTSGETVRFGYDSTTNLFVTIPAGSYTGISIVNVTNGYVQANKKGLFTITNEATISGTIQHTIEAKATSFEGHTHTFASLTSKPTTLSGYGITDAVLASTFNTHNNDNVRHITASERSNWNDKYTQAQSNARFLNKSLGFTANLDTNSRIGVSYWGDSAIGRPEDWGTLLQISSRGINEFGSNQWHNQLAFGTSGSLSFRNATNRSTWNVWKTIYHTGNLNPANYVKKSGDTMTGSLNVDSIAITSTINKSHLKFSRADYNYITSVGHLGFITNNGTRGSAAQQLWLHTNGNTKIGAGSSAIPTETLEVNGNAKANTFIGSLSGNASTASKLASITTSFTGTYPVTFNVNGTIYSHTGITYTGSTNTLTATNFNGNASSATKLATAKNINGTSFDGTAAITTANWGTSRTLTIGSIGKSVNGSADVSWTLAEIGAAVGDNVSYIHNAGSGARWIRVAEFSHYTSYGIISILNSYNNNPPNSVTFYYNSGYRTASSPSITQIGGRAGIYTKARVVYPTSTNVPSFIEVYYNTTSVGNTLYLRLTNSFNCKLLRTATVGSVPSTHTSYERSFTNGGISADTVSANTFYGALSGNAATATALTSNAGSTTQPVYFSGGKPVATTYSLGASVPSGAKFTDTNTYVTQAVSTFTTYRPILLGQNSTDSTSNFSNVTNQSYYSNALRMQPSTGNIISKGNVTATSFIGALTGNATSATNLSRSILAGNGLSGGGVLNANRTLTLGTPGTLNNSTTNSVSASSHTHAITGFLPHRSSREAENLDTWRTSGVYAVGNNNTNLPSGAYTYSSILISQSATDRWSQLFLGSYSGGTVARMYYRGGTSSNVWSNWKTVAYLDDNVASATKLQTTRAIKIGPTSKNFDGTANITWTQDEIGHRYVTSLPATLQEGVFYYVKE